MNGGRVRTLLLAGFAVARADAAASSRTTATTSSTARSCSSQKCALLPHARARRTRRASSGPNLDEAWQRSEQDGLGRSTFEGIVHQQILHPNRNAQVDPRPARRCS